MCTNCLLLCPLFGLSFNLNVWHGDMVTISMYDMVRKETRYVDQRGSLGTMVNMTVMAKEWKLRQGWMLSNAKKFFRNKVKFPSRVLHKLNVEYPSILYTSCSNYWSTGWWLTNWWLSSAGRERKGSRFSSNCERMTWLLVSSLISLIENMPLIKSFLLISFVFCLSASCHVMSWDFSKQLTRSEKLNGL